MQLPTTVVMEQSADNLTHIVVRMMKERQLTPDLMSFVLHKVLVNIQSEEIYGLANLYIDSQQTKEEKDEPVT